MITVLVVDPSGIKSVVLRYRRAQDPAPVSVAMALSAGRYMVKLTTTRTMPWEPSSGSSYVVQLSVRATDMKGNVRTTPLAAGFTVHTCP